MRHITCIFNPKAGEGRFKLTPEKLKRRMKKLAKEEGVKIKVDALMTDGEMHCTELAKQVSKDGAEIVVAVGGDGTVNEAVNALANHGDCALGIIPAGSGNDAARSFDIDLEDLDHSIRDILTKEPRTIDLGLMNGKYFIEVLGIGLDAEVSHISRDNREMIHRIGPTGLYAYSAVKVIPGFKPIRMKLEIDNAKPKDYEVAFCTIGNGPTSGGGFKLTPNAKLDDGKLDLTIAKWRGIVNAMTKIKRCYDGRHLNLEQVEHTTFKKLKISSRGKKIAYHMDGEVGFAKVFDIEVVPDALRVVH